MQTRNMALPGGVLSLILLLSHSLMAGIPGNTKSRLPVIKGRPVSYQPVFKTLNSYLAYKETKPLYGDDAAKAYVRKLATIDYLPLTGGTLTGDLFGTNAYFSSKVGIGTTTPSILLHVVGNDNTLGLFEGNNIQAVAVGIKNTNNGSKQLNLFMAGGTGYSISNWANNGIMESDNGLVFSGYNGDITFQTSSKANRMTILNSNGNIGIGTTSPSEKLHVFGAYSSNTWNGRGIFGNENNVAVIGTYNNNAIIGAHNSALNAWQKLYINTTDGSTDGEDVIIGKSLGIGTTNPGPYKLAVEGTIGARQIKVTLANPWADYVFDSSYQLKPLAQVEQYIKDNKHLPEVPTAEQVKKDGIDVGDNQALLLKKIEELTLYMIEMKKENEQLKSRVEQLEKGKN